MKKLLSIMLCMMMVVALVACGGSGGSSSNNTSSGDAGGDSTGVELNALFMKQAGYSEDDVKAMTDAFTAETGIGVNLTFVAYEELEAKILTSAQSGGYDVVLGDCIWPAQFAQAGLVLDVTDKVKALDTGDIFEGALQSCEYGGKYYGLPWLNDVKYMFVNTKMLEEAGITTVPDNWDDVIAACKTLKDQGICEYPMVGCWSQAECLVCDYTCISGGFGGDFVDSNNEPTLNSDKNVAALQMMKDMLDEGLVNPKSLEMIEDDVLSTFAARSAAFAINWTYQFNAMNDDAASSVVGEAIITPIPGTSAAKSATVNGGMPLMITAGSAHPDEAWQYMEYISSKDVQAQYSANALPMWKSLYTDAGVIEAGGKEVVEASLVQYDYIKNRPMVPYYNELSTYMQTSIQNVLLGNETPQGALDALQDKAIELSQK